MPEASDETPPAPSAPPDAPTGVLARTQSSTWRSTTGEAKTVKANVLPIGNIDGITFKDFCMSSVTPVCGMISTAKAIPSNFPRVFPVVTRRPSGVTASKGSIPPKRSTRGGTPRSNPVAESPS